MDYNKLTMNFLENQITDRELEIMSAIFTRQITKIEFQQYVIGVIELLTEREMMFLMSLITEETAKILAENGGKVELELERMVNILMANTVLVKSISEKVISVMHRMKLQFRPVEDQLKIIRSMRPATFTGKAIYDTPEDATIH